MPSLPIEWTTRPLGPTGVVTLEGGVAGAVSHLRISYQLDDTATESSVPAPGLFRMFVNALAAFATTLFVTLSAFALVPIMWGFDPVIVTSASMEPSLRRSDVVVLAPIDGDAVAVGSIVNFRGESGDLIHRVVEVEVGGYRTKGDANQSVDSTLVGHDDITGTGVFLVPFVGLPPLWADDGAWWKLAALAVALIAVGTMAQRRWLTSGHARSGG